MTKNNLQNIKLKAKKLLKESGGNSPVNIANYLNIIILQRNYKKLSGAFSVINKVPFIFINENLDFNQKNLVLAHEIGHFILHKKIIKDLLILRDFSLFDKQEHYMENEANLFAFFLLVDENKFKEKLKEGLTVEEVSKYFNIDMKLSVLYISTLTIYNF